MKRLALTALIGLVGCSGGGGGGGDSGGDSDTVFLGGTYTGRLFLAQDTCGSAPDTIDTEITVNHDQEKDRIVADIPSGDTFLGSATAINSFRAVKSEDTGDGCSITQMMIFDNIGEESAQVTFGVTSSCGFISCSSTMVGDLNRNQ